MTAAPRLLSEVNTSLAAEHTDSTVARSDYVVILAALFCAVICAIGLALVARCVCLHRRLELSFITSSRPAPPPPPPGLNKKTLRLLPTTSYVSEVASSSSSSSRSECSDKQVTDCAICLTEFCDGDKMRILPQCGHVFHVNCIDPWLGSHSSCPSCRQSVLVVARCRHCGGFSGSQGGFSGNEIEEREIAMMSRQDYVHRFLP